MSATARTIQINAADVIAAVSESLEALERPDEPVMQEGAKAAAKADGQTAGARAGEALALMEALKRKKNAFCKAMEGEGEEGPAGAAPPSPVLSHPDFHGRSRNLTGSTPGWLPRGRGLSPPVGNLTPPRRRAFLARV